MTFDTLLEQDLKDDIIKDVMSDDNDDLLDGIITQTDIDKANALSDDDESEEEFKQEV